MQAALRVAGADALHIRSFGLVYDTRVIFWIEVADKTVGPMDARVGQGVVHCLPGSIEDFLLRACAMGLEIFLSALWNCGMVGCSTDRSVIIKRDAYMKFLLPRNRCKEAKILGFI